MLQVNIHEAKTSLSRLIQRALEGEKIIVCKRNVPLIELTPLQHNANINAFAKKRVFQAYPKPFHFQPDALAPMDDNEIDTLFFPESPDSTA